jgi:hypothetical protein
MQGARSVHVAYNARMDPDDLETLHELMDEYALDAEEAIRVKELMDEEGLTADEAIELREEL